MLNLKSIPAPKLAAAQICQESKNSVRYYLAGICLTPEAGGTIVGTNGHVLYAGKCATLSDLDTPIIISIDGKIPAKAETANIEQTTPTTGTVTLKDKNGLAFKTLLFTVIDGTYPSWERVLPKGPAEPTESIGLGWEPMQRISQALKALGVHGAKFNFHGPDNSVEIICKEDTLVIMPMRIK